MLDLDAVIILSAIVSSTGWYIYGRFLVYDLCHFLVWEIKKVHSDWGYVYAFHLFPAVLHCVICIVMRFLFAGTPTLPAILFGLALYPQVSATMAQFSTETCLGLVNEICFGEEPRGHSFYSRKKAFGAIFSAMTVGVATWVAGLGYWRPFFMALESQDLVLRWLAVRCLFIAVGCCVFWFFDRAEWQRSKFTLPLASARL